MSQHSFKALSSNLWVCPQISLDDINMILEAGIKTVVCHRPDEELSPDNNVVEPDYQTVSNLLEKQGVTCIYQPMHQLTMPEVERFSEILAQAKSPVLAYCTSGTRSTLLWALGQTHIHQQPREAVIEAAQQAGYEISRYLS